MSYSAVGTDIIDVNRFRRKPYYNNSHFYSSIFTKREMKYCLKYSDPYPHFAGIFAAKEAIMKCLAMKVAMKNVEIIRKCGRPVPIVHVKDNIKLAVSISHTETLALAVAIKY